MRRLAQKLEEDGTDSELRRYCERILRVRSTGWTQGIFANFAAESVVPKGPEWGGGNWEIKTPTNLKAIPQWELAGEVMPYMRTDDGSLPSIVADHIGVYLGSVKGRGSIVEVREDSLVKAFTPAGGSVDKSTGLQTPLAKSISNKSKASSDGEPKDNLMGLETLMKQSSSSASADEQAKAEEEFKKTMYGTTNDGSSSDEENVSRTRKIHIRIRDKPVTSATVDVKKIKEATMQFKLGEGFGPPISRTKSLTGSSQDLMQSLSQPPATTAATAPIVSTAPIDPFGTDSLIQPAPVLQSAASQGTGGGVAARPIPEDFFQNTIPSLQIAASLPPPGTYLSQLDPGSHGPESNKVSSNQVNVSEVSVGLSDGGVPPQATQQPAIPVSFESVGLPDGGVPPQSLGQATPMPPPQVQAVRPSLPSQPLDLSVLGVPDSGDSGKPAPQPTSVRPGQVHKYLLNYLQWHHSSLALTVTFHLLSSFFSSSFPTY